MCWIVSATIFLVSWLIFFCYISQWIYFLGKLEQKHLPFNDSGAIPGGRGRKWGVFLRNCLDLVCVRLPYSVPEFWFLCLRSTWLSWTRRGRLGCSGSHPFLRERKAAFCISRFAVLGRPGLGSRVRLAVSLARCCVLEKQGPACHQSGSQECEWRAQLK